MPDLNYKGNLFTQIEVSKLRIKNHRSIRQMSTVMM